MQMVNFCLEIVKTKSTGGASKMILPCFDVIKCSIFYLTKLDYQYNGTTTMWPEATEETTAP